MAVMDASGFTIRLYDAKLSNATSNAVGQCLTIGDQTLARYTTENRVQIGYKIGRTLQSLFNLMLIREIDPLLHMMDGALAYFSGVIHSMGQVLMAQFVSQCNPPEIYLRDVVRCACDDTALAIPDSQAAQTWREYALWCSGTLSMVDGSNNPFVVFNPYSYAQLQAMAKDMQSYVDCASTSYQCDPPLAPAFDMQGVSVLNVLVKCRENFVEQRWDPAAYVLFDPSQAYRYKVPPGQRVVLPPDTLEVQRCLAYQTAAGASNSACLDRYLGGQTPRMPWDLYWAYNRAAPGGPPERVDACLTFSGPAAKGVAVFQDCVDDEAQSVCTLSGHVWSPTSNNSIPVGQPHAVMYHGSQADSVIYRLYNKASRIIDEALDAAIAHWSVNQGDVNAQFFSAEGDVSTRLSRFAHPRPLTHPPRRSSTRSSTASSWARTRAWTTGRSPSAPPERSAWPAPTGRATRRAGSRATWTHIRASMCRACLTHVVALLASRSRATL